MFRHALNYGGLLGIGTMTVFIILYKMGYNPLGNASWLSAWIPVVVIAKSTAAYRNEELEGYMSYGEGFRIGVLTGAAGGLLSALMIYIFCTIVDASIVDDFKTQTLDQMQLVEKQMRGLISDNMYDKAIEAYNNISIQSIVTSEFSNKLIGGILISLITAAVYKKNKPFIPPSA
jgi:hypothetical protein